jgi:hypothetical protein
MVKDKGHGLYRAEIQGIGASTPGSDTSARENLTFPKSAIAQKVTSPSLTICSRGKNLTLQIGPDNDVLWTRSRSEGQEAREFTQIGRMGRLGAHSWMAAG